MNVLGGVPSPSEERTMSQRPTARVNHHTMLSSSNSSNVNRMRRVTGEDGRITFDSSSLEISSDYEDDLRQRQQLDNDDNEDSDDRCPASKKDQSMTTIEQQYHLEREQTKLRYWKESGFAAGCVEPTWADELANYNKRAGAGGCCFGGGCCCCPSDEEGSVDMGQIFHEEIDPGCGCIYLSAVFCSRLGAGRIGNMIVLKERYVMVEVDDNYDNNNDDEENEECNEDDEEEEGGEQRADGYVVNDDDEEVGDMSLNQQNRAAGGKNKRGQVAKTTRLVRKREIQLVVGPFWPMLIFITYPLIFAVSAWTLYSGIPGKPWFVQALWAMLTLLLIRSLYNTGFRDPGILQRYHTPPPPPEDNIVMNSHTRRIGYRWGNEEVGPWRWTEQTHSYRPKGSMYCTDCKVVIEEFDHTCPWTGTAIGKKNMSSFQMFVALVFLCLIVDIFLITSGKLG